VKEKVPLACKRKPIGQDTFRKRQGVLQFFLPRSIPQKRAGLFVVSFLSFNPNWAGWFFAALVFGDSVGAFEVFTHVFGHFRGS
jgi:hypothetical protein